MTAKITGLEDLIRHFEDAQTALKAVDGELGTVNFDPNDASSIELAVFEMEMKIDNRLGSYSDNPIISPLMFQMKTKYREAIIDRAVRARLEGEQPDGS